MNLMQMHQCGNVNCHSHVKGSIQNDNKATFTRPVYQVDATTICRIIQRNEYKCLYQSFGQLLHLASKERQRRQSRHQINQVLLLQNAPDLIPVAIHWNPFQCTTSEVEDLVSIIDPFITLRELFGDVPIDDARRLKQLNLIGLICFYGGSIEVFFSYEHSTSKWLFCFDGHITIIADWNAVIRKCIDFHLQPFLLIYVNSQQNPVDITQLLKRTVIEEKIIPYERRLESSMTKQEQFHSNKNKLKHEIHSFDNLSKISSFATLNSSMLFLPKPTAPASTSSYINQETVVKVMQQQLLRKELLSEVTSTASLSSSPLVHIRQRYPQKQKSDDTLSSEDSSTSSQRDSGLSSGINDGSSDDSPRDSLAENEQIESDVKQTEQMINDTHFDMSLASIEYYLEQSLKHESASNYSSALDSCQRALILIDQIFNLSQHCNTRLSVYIRSKKNSLLLRIRSLRKRLIEYEELNYTAVKSVAKKNPNTTSILSPISRLSRPKKNVKFSDNVALIVPRFDDDHDPPTEHLIHSFLRNIHQQSTTSDSDSDTPSSPSLNEIPIGLSECSLCHKRFSKTNQLGSYCSNCHFYMQRFQPTNS